MEMHALDQCSLRAAEDPLRLRALLQQHAWRMRIDEALLREGSPEARLRAETRLARRMEEGARLVHLLVAELN